MSAQRAGAGSRSTRSDRSRVRDGRAWQPWSRRLIRPEHVFSSPPNDRARTRRNGDTRVSEAASAAHTVVALFRATAERHGGRPALSDERMTLSFAELAGRVECAATTLAAAGIGAGRRVAVLLPNSLAFVETFLAVLERGAAALPIATAAPATEIRRLVADASADALIAAPPQARTLTGDTAACLAHDGTSLAIVRALPVRNGEAPRPLADTPALIAFSSGTIARPHVVTRTHENLWWEAQNFWETTRLTADDVVLGMTPLSHAHGLGNALLASVRAGAHLIVRSRFLRRETLDVLGRERVTVFPTVPFVARMLAATDRRRSWDLGALRLCFSAGAPLAPEVFARFRERFGVPIRQLYGLTEAGSVTLNTAPVAELDPSSAGTPLGNVRVTIEDRDGRPLPSGVPGEIVVRSPAAAGGADHALRTQDLGHWSARGELVVTGRTSLFINAAGNKVDAAEVEAALRSHPAVADVAVYGAPAAHREQVVAAAIVLRSPCSPELLRMHCRALIAAYKVPRVFTFLDALPRSPLGKVLIGRLRAEA